MTDAVAKEYGIRFKTIQDALCVGSTELAVDAVLSSNMGIHTVNLGKPYPRKRFFDEIIAVMEADRYVPIFNDKHLSYRTDWAEEMLETANSLGIPFLAGSSVPLAERQPNIEIRKGAKIEEAVSIHGGPVESYDFHALEVLQSMVEHRRGGETGIKRITFYEGEQIYQAAKAGIFDWELVNAAMTAELGHSIEQLGKLEGETEITPHAIVLEYLDGFKTTFLRAGRSDVRWNFASQRLKNHWLQVFMWGRGIIIIYSKLFPTPFRFTFGQGHRRIPLNEPTLYLESLMLPYAKPQDPIAHEPVIVIKRVIFRTSRKRILEDHTRDMPQPPGLTTELRQRISNRWALNLT